MGLLQKAKEKTLRNLEEHQLIVNGEVVTNATLNIIYVQVWNHLSEFYLIKYRTKAKNPVKSASDKSRTLHPVGTTEVNGLRFQIVLDSETGN